MNTSIEDSIANILVLLAKLDLAVRIHDKEIERLQFEIRELKANTRISP